MDRAEIERGLEEESRDVLGRVARELLRADRGSLVPTSTMAPLVTSIVMFRQDLGETADGIAVGQTHRIELERLASGPDRIVWTRDVAGPHQHAVVLSESVARHLQGELENGMDDNGNRLIDESGFSLVVDRRLVTIRLTLERHAGEELLTTTHETVVALADARGR